MSEMQRDGSEMRCKRCGANESRIHGFCSVECEHYFDYEEEITDLNTRIAELEAERRWIPVSERLPEDGVAVLVAFTENPKDIDILTAKYYKHYAGFGGLDNWWNIEGWHTGNVTHWIPLPEPPIMYGKVCEE